MNPEKLHAISGKVVEAKNKLECWEGYLELLIKCNDVDARLDLTIDRRKRSSTIFYLDKEEVIPLIESRIKKIKQDLLQFENDFKKYTV